MELDDKAKLASQRLTDAINAAARESEAVRDAIASLRDIGYEAKLSFHMNLIPVEPKVEAEESIIEDFTEDDRKALRRMLIRVK